MITTTLTPDSQWCQSCVQEPDRQCKSCAARRRVAGRLFEQGDATIAEIAHQMHLTPVKVIRLLEELEDRRALHCEHGGEINNALVREKFDVWQRQDPDRHTYLELARRAGYDSSSRVQRLLGLISTSMVVKNGVVYPGQIRSTISCENAGRLVRAMGHLPCETPGL